MIAIRVVCAAAAALFLAAVPAAAQSSSVAGRVTDPDRAAVAGAAVVLSQLPSGIQRAQVAEGDGSFRFTGLPVGGYRLEIAPVREKVTVEGVATVPTIGRIPVPLRD